MTVEYFLSQYSIGSLGNSLLVIGGLIAVFGAIVFLIGGILYITNLTYELDVCSSLSVALLVVGLGFVIVGSCFGGNLKSSVKEEQRLLQVALAKTYSKTALQICKNNSIGVETNGGFYVIQEGAVLTEGNDKNATLSCTVLQIDQNKNDKVKDSKGNKVEDFNKLASTKYLDPELITVSYVKDNPDIPGQVIKEYIPNVSLSKNDLVGVFLVKDLSGKIHTLDMDKTLVVYSNENKIEEVYVLHSRVRPEDTYDSTYIQHNGYNYKLSKTIINLIPSGNTGQSTPPTVNVDTQVNITTN